MNHVLRTARTDTATSTVIDTAIKLARDEGHVFAWVYLARFGISESSIARILQGRHRAVELAGLPRKSPVAPD